MSIATLLSDLEHNGINIDVNGDRLRIDAPKDLMTPELANRLREHKPELIRLLQGNPEAQTSGTPAKVEDILNALRERTNTLAASVKRFKTWLEKNPTHPKYEQCFEAFEQEYNRWEYHRNATEALQGRGYILIRTAALPGEHIIILRDSVITLPADHADTTRYTLQELAELVGAGWLQVKQVHTVKSLLGGVIER